MSDPAARRAALGLAPHPEGGAFREVFRGTVRVEPADGRGARAGLTAIWFLLEAGERSRWHRVASDEAWHWCEGAPLELWRAEPELGIVERVRLGPLAEGQAPLHVVPAGWWQAARSLGDYTLVSCTVGPGFDFADFAMLADHPAEAARLAERHPEAARLT